MKFTKTAVAVAIAGIAAAPMIASADTTLSGVVQIQLNGDDSDTGADPEPGDATINADDVLFGIVSEHELNNGLTGYGSLRVDMNRLSNAGAVTVDPGTPANDDDDTSIGSLGTADSVYVGVKGGFGDVRFGEIPLAIEYGQVANDIYDVGPEINGGISYVGTFGPAGVIANFSPENNSDAVGLGAKFGIGGFSVGLGYEDRPGAGRAGEEAMSAGVSFAFAGASINAHYWTESEAENGEDLESIAVKAGYGFGGVSADLTFATLEGDTTDQEAIRLDLVYDLGGGMDVSSRITAETNNEDDSDLTSWRVKLSKAF